MRTLWRQFWARAPRQLAFTRSGRVLVGVALAVGFAAINTGNNLLLLSWGLLLGSILLSGALSEAVVRRAELRLDPPALARADEVTHLAARLQNQARWLSAYCLRAGARVAAGSGEQELVLPLQLRLGPGQQVSLTGVWVPAQRGCYRVAAAWVETTFPFGFFRKRRRLSSEGRQTLWVAPRREDVSALVQQLRGSLGEIPVHVRGRGDEFFALREFQPGDDPRRIHWRRSARSARLLTGEYHAASGERIVLELCLAASLPVPVQETAIAMLGSLAEDLLGIGQSVGILAPGICLDPASGAGQLERVLAALARLEPQAPVPQPPPWPGCSRVALLAGGRPHAGSQQQIDLRGVA